MAGPDDEEQKKRPSPPPVEFVKPGEAPAPLPPRDQPPAAWVTRPEDYLRQVAPAPQLRAPGQMHLVAGILLVLSALVAVGWTIALSIRFLTPAQYENATAGLAPRLSAGIEYRIDRGRRRGTVAGKSRRPGRGVSGSSPAGRRRPPGRLRPPP